MDWDGAIALLAAFDEEKAFNKVPLACIMAVRPMEVRLGESHATTGPLLNLARVTISQHITSLYITTGLVSLRRQLSRQLEVLCCCCGRQLLMTERILHTVTTKHSTGTCAKCKGVAILDSRLQVVQTQPRSEGRVSRKGGALGKAQLPWLI